MPCEDPKSGKSIVSPVRNLSFRLLANKRWLNWAVNLILDLIITANVITGAKKKGKVVHYKNIARSRI